MGRFGGCEGLKRGQEAANGHYATILQRFQHEDGPRPIYRAFRKVAHDITPLTMPRKYDSDLNANLVPMAQSLHSDLGCEAEDILP